MLLLIGILSVALISTLSLTPITISAARRIGYLDKPGARKIHSVPTPLLGGLAVLVGFSLAFAFGQYFSNVSAGNVFTGFISGALLILIIGLIDDGLGMTPGSKLLGQILAAALFLTFSKAGGIMMDTPLDFTIGILWMITLMNALNFLDNMDGLCSGVSFSAALGFTMLGLQSNEPFLVITGVSLMGALIGFIFFNLNPARIFLGDAGSMFLGFTLASMGIVFAISHPDPQDLLSPLLILSYPLFDISFVTFNRLREGRSLAQGGKDHTSHRLVDLGFRSNKAVWGIFAICIILALLGNILFMSIDSNWKLIMVVLVAFLLLIFGVHLSRRFVNIKEKVLLIVLDGVGIVLAFISYHYIRFQSGLFEAPTYMPLNELIPAIIWITFYWYFIFGILGQYDFTWDRYFKVEIVKLLKAIVIGIGIFIIMAFDLSKLDPIWIFHLIVYGGLMFVILFFLRWAILSISARYYIKGKWKRRAIIIGSEKTFPWFDNILNERPQIGIVPVEKIQEAHFEENPDDALEELRNCIKKNRASEVIILEPGKRHETIFEIVRLGNITEVNFRIFKELRIYLRGLKMENLKYSGMLKVYSDRMRTWEWGFKRIIDIIGSMILIVISIPVYILTAMIIFMNLGGSVLAWRNYIGQGREIIRIPKFKINRQKSGDQGTETQQPWDSSWGKFIYRTGIYKIPMLSCVLNGKLSLVGPAPDSIERGDRIAKNHPLYERRWAVKPGLISLASVQAGNGIPGRFSNKTLDLDLKYMETMSMLTDIRIILNGILKFWSRKLS